jgi:hypothetical protein
VTDEVEVMSKPDATLSPSTPGTMPAGAKPSGVKPTGVKPTGAPVADPAPTGPIDVPPASAVAPPAAPPGPDAVAPPAAPPGPDAVAPPAAPPGPDAVAHATAPVTVRPAPRGLRRGPLTRMGPWAPVAGGALGVLLGLVVVLLLGSAADQFRERLALVYTVVGLGLLGAAGTLLADEVRIVRRGAREAAVRPAWVEATAGLVNGLTPARLLLLVSAFVLFLAAYVAR